MKGSFIERFPESIRSSLCNRWALKKSLSMNELALNAHSLRPPQGGMTRAAHSDDDKTYNRHKPSLGLRRNERTMRHVEVSCLILIHARVITLELNYRSIIKKHRCRHAQVENSLQYSSPDLIAASDCNQATVRLHVCL